IGAYYVGTALWPALFSQLFMTGAYDIQRIHLTLEGVFTNTSYTGPYRGAGRPESIYIVERLIDEAARTLRIAPEEMRRRNLIPDARIPYTTPTRWTYDSGDFRTVMDKCLALGDWAGYSARKSASTRNGKLRGHAVSYFIEQGGVLNERMDLRFD